MSGSPHLSVVVINYERPEMTARCLTHVAQSIAGAGIEADTFVIDNGSRDDSVAALARLAPWASVIALPENAGLPAALNRGWRASASEWVLLLNNDVLIDKGALAAAYAAAELDPGVGTVALEMRFAGAPDVVNSAGISVDRLGVPFDLRIGRPVHESPGEPSEVFGACGGAALYRRAMLDALGGFDETFGFGFEDVDLSWRAQMRGWRVLLAPEAVALHAHGGTVAAGSPFRTYQAGLNRVRLLAKHATAEQLRRYGLAMVAYDVAYVTYALLRHGSGAALTGRLRGLREWRVYRSRGREGRRPVELARVQGLRAALRRRAAWSSVATPPSRRM